MVWPYFQTLDPPENFKGHLSLFFFFFPQSGYLNRQRRVTSDFRDCFTLRAAAQYRDHYHMCLQEIEKLIQRLEQPTLPGTRALHAIRGPTRYTFYADPARKTVSFRSGETTTSAKAALLLETSERRSSTSSNRDLGPRLHPLSPEAASIGVLLLLVRQVNQI